MEDRRYLEAYEAAYAVVQAARAYREEEQDGTPRLWRGKKLHDLGLRLDAAIDEFDAFCSEAFPPRPMTSFFATLTPEQQAKLIGNRAGPKPDQSESDNG